MLDDVLLGVSCMDVAVTVIAELTISTPHTVPIPFELAYDPAVIDQRMVYKAAGWATMGSQSEGTSVSDVIVAYLRRSETARIIRLNTPKLKTRRQSRHRLIIGAHLSDSPMRRSGASRNLEMME